MVAAAARTRPLAREPAPASSARSASSWPPRAQVRITAGRGWLLRACAGVGRGKIPSKPREPMGQLRDRVRELERERVTVQEAARRLGITESAVRKRVQRGQLEHDKEPGRRLYVHLDKQDKYRDRIRDSSYDMLVRRLENENEFLRLQLEHKDAILLNMTEAMKALNPPAQEAPSEARESPETVEEASEGGEPPP